MVAPLVLAVLLLVVVAALVWVVLTHERTDETERFNRARDITSSWAAPGGVFVMGAATDDVPVDESADRQR